MGCGSSTSAQVPQDRKDSQVSIVAPGSSPAGDDNKASRSPSLIIDPVLDDNNLLNPNAGRPKGRVSISGCFKKNSTLEKYKL